MSWKFALLALPVAVIAQSTVAQPAAPQSGVPSWTVAAPQSKLSFAASMNGQGFAGSFARWTARIRFDPKNLAASRVAVVVDTASARTGDASRDEALPTDDWFAVGKFPQAVFQAASFREQGGGRYTATGTLKLRGVSAPLTLPFTLSIVGDTATMRGSATIDRRSFGVGGGQFATGETVATGVRIDIALVAKRAR